MEIIQFNKKHTKINNYLTHLDMDLDITSLVTLYNKLSRKDRKFITTWYMFNTLLKRPQSYRLAKTPDLLKLFKIWKISNKHGSVE